MQNRNRVSVKYLTFQETTQVLNLSPDQVDLHQWLAECERLIDPLWTERFEDKYPSEVARLAMKNIIKRQ